MDTTLSRRKLIRCSAAAVGVGAAGSLAGCGAIRDRLPFIGGGGEYQRWLVEPGAVSDDDHYIFTYNNYEQIRDHEDEFADETYSRYEDPESIFSSLGLEVSDMSWTLSISAVTDYPTVLSGEFTESDVVDAVGDAEEEDTVGEYTTYASSSSALALQDGTAVLAESTDALDQVEALLDSANGDADRYADDSEDMNELLGLLGSGTFVYGTTSDPMEETDAESGQFEGQVGFGYTDTVDGGTTATEIVALFQDQDAVDMDAVEAYTDGAVFEDYDTISASQNGRAAIVSGTVDTSDLYG